MVFSNRVERRAVFSAGIGLMAASLTSGRSANAAEALDADAGVTTPEDLMKEHGVLNRCLLIYEEAMRRIRGKVEIDPAVIGQTAGVVKLFVVQYHEMNEEKYIFPVFERAKQKLDLVETLKAQHVAGRKVTAEILRIAALLGVKVVLERG